jgi:hypothetical protein
VEGLENRLEKMEKLLQKVRMSPPSSASLERPLQLCPEGDFSADLGDPHLSKLLSSAPQTSKSSPSTASSVTLAPAPLMRASPSDEEELFSSDDDTAKLAVNLKRLAVSSSECDHRFFGKSSNITFVRTALDLRDQYTGRDDSQKFCPKKRSEFWSIRPVSSILFFFLVLCGHSICLEVGTCIDIRIRAA